MEKVKGYTQLSPQEVKNLIENEKEIQREWFVNKKQCGVSAGASTPDWVINLVLEKIKEYA